MTCSNDEFFSFLTRSGLFDDAMKVEIARTFDTLSGDRQALFRTILIEERKMVREYLRSLKDAEDTDFITIRQHMDEENRKLIARLEQTDSDRSPHEHALALVF